MSLGCARCGDCCAEIWIPTGAVEELRGVQAGGEIAAQTEKGIANWEFMQNNWRPTGDVDERHGQAKVTCDQYDAVEQLCMAHEDRPPVCRDFPWYGGEPGDLGGGALSKRCSYWLDVAPRARPEGTQPLIPITLALQSARGSVTARENEET